MSLEINIEQPANTTRVLVPLDIPTVLVESGAVELYAIKKTGWCAKVKDENDNEIDNPINAITAAANDIRLSVKETYRLIAEEMAIEQAKNLVSSQFNQMFENAE